MPYTRGAEMSRPAEAVLAEARRLVAQGAREITLLGQNVNAWHGAAAGQGAPAPGDATWGLGRLLRAMAEIPGLLRLRYTTSHPRDMDDALIAAHRDVPMLMPFLHLPVQSGSDRMLAAMNRRHTAADYLRLVERLRAARPDLALSSDFIVGHPGETDGGFRRRRWRWCARSASRRRSASNTPPAPARRRRARRARCRRRRRIAACRNCRRCCASSRRASTPAASA